MSGHGSHHGGHEQVGHLVPVGVLFKTAVALLVLTAVTVWIADFDFGAINIWVALAIAVLKGSFVVLFFMHLRWDRPFNGVIFLTALALVALFISFALTDTTEYAPDMITGNAPSVQQELDALKK
jgi:cytochrome c oxidase subunit 4